MSAAPTLPLSSAESSSRASRGRKPVQAETKLRARRSAAKDSKERPFAGKQFVGFETAFLEAIYHGASSLSELKLILLVAKLANDREIGNPFGRTAPIMPVAIADEIGCTTQNIRCSASVWFYDAAAAKAGEPTGLIERFEHQPKRRSARKADGEAPAYAYELQIRADYVETWAKRREQSRRNAEDLKRQQEAARQAALAAAAQETAKRRRSWKSAAPIRVGPKAPFKLPDEARELVRENCSAITATREGTIKDLRITPRGVLEFDFDPAPAAAIAPPAPPQSPRKTMQTRKSTCDFAEAFIETKGLTNSNTAKSSHIAPHGDARLIELAAGLKARQIVATEERAAGVIREIGTIPVAFFLSVLDTKVQKARSRRKPYDPAWLVQTAKDAASAWQLDRLAASARTTASAAEVDRDRELEQARRFLANRDVVEPDLIEWAESVLGGRS